MEKCICIYVTDLVSIWEGKEPKYKIGQIYDYESQITCPEYTEIQNNMTWKSVYRYDIYRNKKFCESLNNEEFKHIFKNLEEYREEQNDKLCYETN